MLRSDCEQGFTIVELLIASALVVSALAGLAHLATLGAMRGRAARAAGPALTLAQSKLEELRALPWSYDSAGAPLSDPALAISPTNALTTDLSGWSDALDAFGHQVPADAVHDTVYRRRWSIGRVDAADADTLLLHVCVLSPVAFASVGHGLPDACVSTIRARKP
jgi:Tfp pilus assembly protein PilV